MAKPTVFDRINAAANWQPQDSAFQTDGTGKRVSFARHDIAGLTDVDAFRRIVAEIERVYRLRPIGRHDTWFYFA